MNTKQRITIADDNPVVQHLLRLILEKAGYAVELTASGERLFTGGSQRPHLILLDRELAGEDGLDICRRLKNRPDTCDIPVVMISATPQLGQLARDAGANDFIEKPFRMKQLLELVDRYLGRNITA